MITQNLGGYKVANDKNTKSGHEERYRWQRKDVVGNVPDQKSLLAGCKNK